MEASKLTVNKYVRGSRMMSVLKFLHEKSKENPRFLKDTTIKSLAHIYVVSTPNSCSWSAAQMAFMKLIGQNFITRHPRPGTRRSDIRINYLHPALPENIRDEAPQEEKDYISRVNARLQKKLDDGENAELDPKTGVITTKTSEPEKKHESYEELLTRIKADPNEAEPVCSEKLEQKPESTSLPTPQPTPQPMEIKRDGNNLTLTININLNGMLQ